MTKIPILLTFVGMPGAGKDTCADYVVQKYTVPMLHFGNMVYDEIMHRGLDIVRDEQYVREDMRAKDGPAVLAKRVAKKVNEYTAKGADRIVLNGLYSWSEYKYLAQEFGEQLVVVAIVAPKTVRWQRLLDRKDTRRAYNLDQIKKREIAEIEHLEKGGPIAYADYTLTNTTSLDALTQEIDTLLTNINF